MLLVDKLTSLGRINYLGLEDIFVFARSTIFSIELSTPLFTVFNVLNTINEVSVVDSLFKVDIGW